jgi:hypothetical protein
MNDQMNSEESLAPHKKGQVREDRSSNAVKASRTQAVGLNGDVEDSGMTKEVTRKDKRPSRGGVRPRTEVDSNVLGPKDGFGLKTGFKTYLNVKPICKTNLGVKHVNSKTTPDLKTHVDMKPVLKTYSVMKTVFRINLRVKHVMLKTYRIINSSPKRMATIGTLTEPRTASS